MTELEKTPDPVFWALGDEEELVHDTIDGIVEEFLDSFWEPDMTVQQFLDAIPETVEVIGYKRMEPTAIDCPEVLDGILYTLDETFGDPNGDETKATPAMKAAEQEFFKKIVAEYESWACETSGHKETVNCLDWIKANSPEWLEEKESSNGQTK
jgi:hypothetical protein